MPKSQSESLPSEPAGHHDDYSVKSTVSAYQTTDGGRFTSPTTRGTTPPATSTSPPISTPLVDSVAVMLFCRKHSTVALSAAGKGLWFPVVPIQAGQSYHEAVDDWLHLQLFPYLQQTSPPTVPAVPPGGVRALFSSPQPVEHLRLQVPQHLLFLSRVLLYVEVAFEHGATTAADCCPLSPQVSCCWVRAAEIPQLLNLWGPEPAHYVSYALEHGQHPAPPFRLLETTIRGLQAQLEGSTATAELLTSARFDQPTVVALYGQFSQHCWPSTAMNFFSFAALISAILPEPAQVVQALYRSFTCGAPALTFTNFLLGLAASSEHCPHGGRVGRIRIDYIFRYYNVGQNKDGLDHYSVCWFAHDLLQVGGGGGEPSEEQQRALVAECYTAFGVPPSAPVSRAAFYGAIRELKIRGTSHLFKWSQAHLTALKGQSLYGRMEQTWVACAFRDQMLCLQCRLTRGQCTLARHVVTISNSGTVVRPIRLKVEVERDKDRNSKRESAAAAATRRHSEETFRGDYYCNELIDLITSYNRNADSSPWKAVRLKFLPKLVQLCTEARALLAQEPRVLRLRSPIYVLGDIHGNLADLMTCSEVLWRSGPTRLAANYLFLGDYVDRGNNSVECITYLLCMKIMSPEHFSLLRGNHELRDVQLNFTFERECMEKFGPVQGRKLWECFNQVFDVLPLCAVIDRTVFAAHGGIPSSVTSLTDLERAIPCPMGDPQTQCPVAHQVLWNDPMTRAEFELQLHTLRALGASSEGGGGLLERGFLPNSKRGTAHYFGDKAVDTFLAVNRLSQIIRAHECCPEGYYLHCGGRVLTIFSCSHYCEMRNKAAVALVDEGGGKLSILQIDTRSNHL